MANARDHQVTGFQSIDRMMAVMDSVAATGEAGARLADVAAASGLNRATAHRFLKALQSAAMLDHDEDSGRYFIGLKIVTLSHAAAGRFRLATRIESELRKLVEMTSDTVYLSVRIGHEAVCIVRHEGSFPIRTLTLKVGDRRPLGIGAGSLALLAFLPDEARARAIATAGASYAAFMLAPTEVASMAERSHGLGYALNDGRVISGMSAIAVPLRDSQGTPVAAITVAAIAQRMEEPRRAEIAEQLRRTCAAIESRYHAILDSMSGWRHGGIA